MLRDDRVMVKSGIRKAGSESWLCQLLAVLPRQSLSLSLPVHPVWKIESKPSASMEIGSEE